VGEDHFLSLSILAGCGWDFEWCENLAFCAIPFGWEAAIQAVRKSAISANTPGEGSD
jgi:hypothetical protein